MSRATPERHSHLLRVVYPLIWLFVFLFLTLMGPFRWSGRSKVPRKGGLLILANHLADVDPIAIQIASPRLIHFMGKSELFEMPVLGTAIRWFKTFPVKRGEPDKSAIQHAVALLKAGECVCIFPEGQLSQSGQLQPLLPGAALIVRMAGVPVVCCRVSNTQRILPYGSLFPRPALRWVAARWSTPREFEKGTEGEEIIGWATRELRG